MNVKKLYEQARPLIIWLGLTELAWISYWLLSGEHAPSQFTSAAVVWICAMLVWLVAASALGVRGYYLARTQFFSNFVGFVLVLIFAGIVFGTAPPVWQGLVIAAKNVPDTQLVGIHILRLLAIGTIIKYLQGELPLHFLILGSLTDFFFAISAVIVTLMVANGTLEHGYLIAWHVVGSAVFLGAGIPMFFSVPSPLRISYAKPDTTIVFQFPMLLAPNFTVPLFVVAHAIALIKLIAG